MTDLRVVPLRESPSLSDIPGQMRQLADSIEAGELEPEAVLCIVATGGWPIIYGWGENLGDYGNIGLLELAKTWFTNNRTERS